jgi:hypothetical protein
MEVRPLESSPVFFESMAVAAKVGKGALARLLAKAKHAAHYDLLAGMPRPDVRFGSKADIRTAKNNVRFTPESGHVRCTSLRLL